MIFIPIILFLIPLAYKLKNNVEKWKINVAVDHTKEMYYYIPALVPAGVLFCVFSHSWWSLAVVPFMMLIWWLNFFDGFYNLLRRWWRKKNNQPYEFFTWWYTGTDDEDDAKTDNFLQSIPLWLHKAIKIGGIVITTSLYIFIYLKK